MSIFISSLKITTISKINTDTYSVIINKIPIFISLLKMIIVSKINTDN